MMIRPMRGLRDVACEVKRFFHFLLRSGVLRRAMNVFESRRAASARCNVPLPPVCTSQTAFAVCAAENHNFDGFRLACSAALARASGPQGNVQGTRKAKGGKEGTRHVHDRHLRTAALQFNRSADVEYS
jgi:hypothetical protein